MKKYFLLLTTFVLFLFIQIFSSQPVKADFCGVSCWTDNNCQINEQTSVLDIANKKACMINPACDDEAILGTPTSYCSYLSSGRACQVDSCPDYDGQNGATCEVSGGCWAGVTSGGCEKVKQTGNWDRSEKKCVQCDQQNYHKEVMNCGDTSGIHLNLGSSCSNWNCGGAGDSYCNWAGDQKFESACGADAECDEKVEGDSCASGGKVCSSTGTCACPSGYEWDGTKCILKSPAACTDGTLEGACCTEPGKKCVNSGGTLQCVLDPTCSNCYDTDPADDPTKKGTCYDTVNSICGFTSGGCKDTCANNSAVTEYYCSGSGTSKSCMPKQVSCSSSDICQYGAGSE